MDNELPLLAEILLPGLVLVGSFMVTISILDNLKAIWGAAPGPAPDPYATGMQGWDVLDEARRIVENAARDGA